MRSRRSNILAQLIVRRGGNDSEGGENPSRMLKTAIFPTLPAFAESGHLPRLFANLNSVPPQWIGQMDHRVAILVALIGEAEAHLVGTQSIWGDRIDPAHDFGVTPLDQAQ